LGLEATSTQKELIQHFSTRTSDDYGKTKLKQLLSRFWKWEYKWLCLLVVVVLALHFAIIAIPDKPVFDELHYVNDARGVISGQETARGEHPSLSKLFVIGGMLIFGDNPLGWRFFSVILGTISIVLFYLICRNLQMTRRASFLATFLLAFENFTFLISGMAMLDVASLTFTLAAFWLYLRGNYPASGIMVALSALAKLNGALAIIAILLHWLIVRRDRVWEFIALMFFAPFFFVFLMPLTDLYTFHQWMNPLTRISTMLSGSAGLTFANVTGTYPQHPIEWIFRWDMTPFYFHPNFLGVVSYSVIFLVVPVLIYLLVKAIKHHDAGFFGLCWFAGTYLIWIPAVWITNRVTYPYYIYPTIGVFCIGLGMGLSELIRIFEVRRSGKLRWAAISFVVLFLLAHLIFFVLVSPLSYYWGTPIFHGLAS
jgi:predicted membrane-bound dolichyl-phosphate-mannose-protein mannosyltransferase